jgi:hypothetical protein
MFKPTSMEVAMTYLLAVVLIATNFSGTWAGTVVTDADIPMHMTLSQNGNTFSGTFGGDQQAQYTKTRAVVAETTLTVEAHPGSIFRLDLKLNGEKLVGQVFKDDRIVGTVTLERVRQ